MKNNLIYYCRFIVRDFTYNEEELALGKSEINKLATDKKKQFVSFCIQIPIPI